MARQIDRLDALKVKNLTKPGYHNDGSGLYLQVTKHEGDDGPYLTKSWIFRYKIAGRERHLGLGSASDVPLAKAREKAREAREQVKAGIDPIAARKAAKAQAALQTAKGATFKDCAEAYIRKNEAAWRNAKHAGQWTATLATYAYPIIGDLPISAIDTGLVLQVLEPIWLTKTETASRLRGRIETVLDYARVRGYRDGENPARWKGHLSEILPARSKVQKVQHHAALSYDDIGDFMAALRQRPAIAAKGLEFQILTATRSGEVMGAKWSEIDMAKKLWVIPAERMKAGEEHRVPLCERAMAILREMQAIGGEFVFPGTKPSQPLSSMAFLMLLRRMKREDLTAHGFRSTFRDWCAERTHVAAEVAEMALAHKVTDKVEAAYRRSDLFDKRRQLMDAWADFCALPSAKGGDNVTPIRKAD